LSLLLLRHQLRLTAQAHRRAHAWGQLPWPPVGHRGHRARAHARDDDSRRQRKQKCRPLAWKPFGLALVLCGASLQIAEKAA